MKPATKVRKMPRTRRDATRSDAAKRATAERLRAGRERAAIARQALERRQVADFTDWVRAESRAYARYRERLEMFGSSDPETVAARAAWRAAMEVIPHIPTDEAFRRVRGE